MEMRSETEQLTRNVSMAEIYRAKLSRKFHRLEIEISTNKKIAGLNIAKNTGTANFDIAVYTRVA